MIKRLSSGLSTVKAIKLGMAIRPLTISAMSQTVSVFRTAPKITVTPWMMAKIFQDRCPNSY
jgi:hypothetical protein